MTATVAGVYEELPQNERYEACILTGNYGEAGAIDFFGPPYDLPRAISGHNNYYLWGPGGCTGELVIGIGVPQERLEAVFDDVRDEAILTCEYCMPDETNLPVYVSGTRRFPSKRPGRSSSTTTEPQRALATAESSSRAGVGNRRGGVVTGGRLLGSSVNSGTQPLRDAQGAWGSPLCCGLDKDRSFWGCVRGFADV